MSNLAESLGLPTRENVLSIMTNLFVIGNLNFALVESKAFHEFSTVLNNHAPIFSRRSLTCGIVETCDAMRDSIKQILALHEGLISFTSDCWVSPNVKSLACATAHCIDSDWKLQSTLLSFRELCGAHTTINLRDNFVQVVTECDTCDKLGGVTLDYASNNNAMVKLLAKGDYM